MTCHKCFVSGAADEGPIGPLAISASASALMSRWAGPRPWFVSRGPCCAGSHLRFKFTLTMAAYDLIRCPTCSARPHDQQKVIKMGTTRQTRSHERPQPMSDGRSPHLHAQIPTHHNLAPPG